MKEYHKSHSAPPLLEGCNVYGRLPSESRYYLQGRISIFRVCSSIDHPSGSFDARLPDSGNLSRCHLKASVQKVVDMLGVVLGYSPRAIASSSGSRLHHYLLYGSISKVDRFVGAPLDRFDRFGHILNCNAIEK